MATPAIRFTCRQCDRAIKVPATKAGKLGFCPGCKGPITVPELSEQPTRARSKPASPGVNELAFVEESSRHAEPEAVGDNTYALADPDEDPSDVGSYEINDPDKPNEAGDDWLSQLPAAVPESDRSGKTSGLAGKTGRGSKPKQVKRQKNRVSLGQALAVDGRVRAVFVAIVLCVTAGAFLSLFPEFYFSRRGRTMSSQAFGSGLLYIAVLIAIFGMPYAILRTLKTWRLLRVGVDVPWRIVENIATDIENDIYKVRIQYKYNGKTYTKKKNLTFAESSGRYRLTLNPRRPKKFILQP